MKPVLRRTLRVAGGILICVYAISCGIGTPDSTIGPVPPASNVVDVVVNGGPDGTSVNSLYTTVTICVPGSTTQCQTIDNILVDTGSYGLRLLAQVLTLTLPVAPALPSNNALVECTVFLDGYSWGPVAAVDLTIASEKAGSLPVQIIGDARYPTVPADCSSAGANTPEDSVAAFHANGVLGIGAFVLDCPACAVNTIPATYYACTSTACTNTAVALASQVQNPVHLFAADNNGTIITLPAVGSGGAASLTGSLIFGIDTQANNQSGSQTILALQTSGTNVGGLTTVFNGQALTQSFFDSGSNGNFFDDSTIALCPSNLTPFYCPTSTVTRTATLQGATGTTNLVTFFVADASSIGAAITAFPNLAGTTSVANSFDWGLPFYYGRRVATAIEGFTTSAGSGPYVAF